MSNSNIAFVFPGQGSQKVGMLAAAYQQFAVVRETFAEASDVLGYDMWDLVQNADQDALNLTTTTQPVLLSASVALWRAWVSVGGPQPLVMSGHSLGEFSALVCAGSIAFRDGVTLVEKRGEFMQEAVPVGVGAMAAIIGLDDDAINLICEETSAADEGVVAAVNFNSPGQVVIAGHTGSVAIAIEALKKAGAKRALRLPVSAPFHTELMKPAGERLAEVISGVAISTPLIPIIHNVHARIEAGPVNIAATLVDQISSPVQWTGCVQAMVDRGAERFVECGPGKVLNGLVRRIDKSLQCFSVEEPDALGAALAELQV